MKKLGISALILVGMLTGANAAVPQQRRGTTAATNNAQTQSATTSARSAVSARSATRTPAAGTSSNTSAARSATSGRTTVARGSQSSASTTTAARSATVSARAGTTQKVISTGTKVAAATQNVVVSEACQKKYDGCMDAFCMLDNESGGRCICSNRNAELKSILTQIEQLDAQSYQMATFGVEKIEMGMDAEAAIAKANEAAQSVLAGDTKGTSSRRSLDLSLWDISAFEEDDGDDFSDTFINASPIEGKEGDALYAAAAELCQAQVPECSAEMSMLRMMYTQRIKSDCLAFENNLKQQKQASTQKLAAAEKALRESALEQLRTANKYDLGQCTIEFKKCMTTTGGCKDDFTGCVGIAAAQNATTKAGADNKIKMYAITGSATKIEIAASSYDTLESKKPLCMSVTNSCVAVKDQVWDTFLREVAPQIKTAELLAESDLRTSCISNISECFQKACKDTMDPNDPDGSYDMCLSRPETLRSLCKVQIDPCESAEPAIMDFVRARLAAMRVDSCTNEVKQCLQSDDRCGKDYTQCVGLDTDTIIRLCPAAKLVACQQQYGENNADKTKVDILEDEDVYNEIAKIVQGIFLNIDNNMLEQCQNAANEAMITVCGDTENCNGLAVDENAGSRSLEYKICEVENGELTNRCYNNAAQISDSDLGRGGDGVPKQFQAKINGRIAWELLDFDDSNLINIDKAIEQYDPDMSQAEKDKVKSELAVVTNSINMAIQAIESDATVDFCMTGRQVQGMRQTKQDGTITGRAMLGEKGAGAGRFANLTSQMRAIVSAAAIAAAQENYYKKYDQVNSAVAKEMITLAERIAKNMQENELDARREAARQACVNYAGSSAIGVGGTAAQGGREVEYVGSASVNTRSYKETITSTYNKETLVCHRCIRKQSCAKMKGKNCRTWGEEQETCNDIQF